MDYEKLYREANIKVAIRFGSNVAKELFPDLYESKDERIRKSLESTKTKLNESMIKPDPYPYWTLAPEYKLMNEQKPAWSEEDMNRINRLIAYFEDEESFTAEDDVVYANWLKSLRPQNHWKPSEEQMEAVRIAAEIGTANNSWAMGVLKSMYQDLKKLMEE